MLKATIKAAILSVIGLFSLAPLVHATESQTIKLCAFPSSPTKTLDIEVAKATFAKMSLGYDIIDLTEELGTESTSEFGISKLLKSKCDVFIGIPISKKNMHFNKGMAISSSYLNVNFVKFRYPDAKITPTAHDVVVVAYETPGQIIAAEEGDKNIQVEDTTNDVIEAVIDGKAEYGVGWYPSLVEYKSLHKNIKFEARLTNTEISTWSLSFVADTHNAALISKISVALHQIAGDSNYQKLLKPWKFESRDEKLSIGPADSIREVAFTSETEAHQSGFRMLRVSDKNESSVHLSDFAAPQINPGKKLYASHCEKCHGDNLQGHTGPALKGPGFAPMKGSTMTIGGIFQFMMTNMPADKPGKLKPTQYADIMAYLLNENGYKPSGKKLNSNSVQDDQSEFDSFVP